MDHDDMARRLGYRDSQQWLATVTGEAAFAVMAPHRLTEYDQIFNRRRPLTPSESELLRALEHPADWDWLETNGHLDNGRLTAAATTAKYVALEACPDWPSR